jgi:hypothetical protein
MSKSMNVFSPRRHTFKTERNGDLWKLRVAVIWPFDDSESFNVYISPEKSLKEFFKAVSDNLNNFRKTRFMTRLILKQKVGANKDLPLNFFRNGRGPLSRVDRRIDLVFEDGDSIVFSKESNEEKFNDN